MLAEHRLHGTRLQSEVALLTREKQETEARLEVVLQEISAFEAGVRGLEREMMMLTKAETEAAGTLDEVAKTELRENKLRLDREFTSMLVKISDRRSTLQMLEKQLQTIERCVACVVWRGVRLSLSMQCLYPALLSSSLHLFSLFPSLVWFAVYCARVHRLLRALYMPCSRRTFSFSFSHARCPTTEPEVQRRTSCGTWSASSSCCWRSSRSSSTRSRSGRR
jgi:hypothetical protein